MLERVVGEAPMIGERVLELRGVYQIPANQVLHGPAPMFDNLGVIRSFGYDVTVSNPVRRRKIPGGTVKLVFAFDGSFGGVCHGPRALVIGMHDRGGISEHSGRMHSVQIQLDPLAAYRLLGAPLGELRNQVVDLSHYFGTSADRLLDRMSCTDDWTRRFELAADLLRERMAAAGDVDLSVLAMRERLGHRNGSVGIAALAEELGRSRRHLTRRFTEQVGLPPKMYASLLRFSRTLRLLASPDPPSLAELALDCAYHDQSHMNRDFRRFADCSPTELFASQSSKTSVGAVP